MEAINIAYNALSRIQAGYDQNARDVFGPKILEALQPYLDLQGIMDILKSEDDHYDALLWEDNKGECYDALVWEDDCENDAQEFAEEIVRRFPQLEIKETFCHRQKSVAVFKMKEDEAK